MDLADRIVDCAVRRGDCADRRSDVGDPPAQAAPAWYKDPTGRYEQRYWDGARWTDHVSTGGKPTVDAVDRSATRAPATPANGAMTAATTPGAPSAMAPLGGGLYVFLLVATFFIPIVGMIVGGINLKHPARNSQAKVLLGLGIVMVIVWFAVASSEASRNCPNAGLHGANGVHRVGAGVRRATAGAVPLDAPPGRVGARHDWRVGVHARVVRTCRRQPAATECPLGADARHGDPSARGGRVTGARAHRDRRRAPGRPVGPWLPTAP